MSKHIEVKKSLVSRARQRGQGMTEYIIITALIAIAGIVVFAAFGDTVKNQTAAMARELAGEDGTAARTQANTRSQAAQTAGQTNNSLQNFVGHQN